MSDSLSMSECGYCGNYHNYSEEMCRDLHKSQAGMFTTIYAPCNDCIYRKAYGKANGGPVEKE
jgi:hypothetical protein